MKEIDDNILAKYLCGEASEHEKAVVEEWLNASHENRAWLERVRKSMDFVPKHYSEGKFDSEKAWRQFVFKRGYRKEKKSFVWRKSFVGLAAAAVALLVVSLAAIRWLAEPEVEMAEWHTADASMTLFLPDSTKVMLAANSSLSYDKKSFGIETRSVNVDGEAYFSVKRDEEKRFMVKMDQTYVTVLGTKFIVETGEGQTSVSVESGKVAFAKNDDSQQVTLTAGMKAVYDVQMQTIKKDDDFEPNDFAWVTGVIVFDAAPLKEVVEVLEKHYGVKLSLVGDSSRKLTATFNNYVLNDILEVIKETLDVELVIEK